MRLAAHLAGRLVVATSFPGTQRVMLVGEHLEILPPPTSPQERLVTLMAGAAGELTLACFEPIELTPSLLDKHARIASAEDVGQAHVLCDEEGLSDSLVFAAVQAGAVIIETRGEFAPLTRAINQLLAAPTPEPRLLWQRPTTH